MTIHTALRLLFRPALRLPVRPALQLPVRPALRLPVRSGRPATAALADDRGQAKAPGLALVVAVLVLVIGIIVTGSHEIIIEAIRSALDAATG